MKILNSKADILELLESNGGKYGVFTLDEAYKFCREVSNSHYENFQVGSILVPKNQRNYFYSIYTFSRLADDISDELTDTNSETKISYLDKLLDLIRNFDNNSIGPKNPLSWALNDTIKMKGIPFTPFEKLVYAFKMDSDFKQPQTMEDNLTYCIYSANPIGELVLRLFDNYNEKTSVYSDAICTGLQLVNFWQDISNDIVKNRIYLPKDILAKYELDEKTLFSDTPKPKLDACLQEIYDYTENFFIFGVELIKFIENKRLKYEITLTVLSGKRILEKVKNYGTDIVWRRPSLRKIDYLALLIQLFSFKGESVNGFIDTRTISKLREGRATSR